MALLRTGRPQPFGPLGPQRTQQAATPVIGLWLSNTTATLTPKNLSAFHQGLLENQAYGEGRNVRYPNIKAFSYHNIHLPSLTVGFWCRRRVALS